MSLSNDALQKFKKKNNQRADFASYALKGSSQSTNFQKYKFKERKLVFSLLSIFFSYL